MPGAFLFTVLTLSLLAHEQDTCQPKAHYPEKILIAEITPENPKATLPTADLASFPMPDATPLPPI